MLKHKVIDLIKSFSPSEIDDFRKFISSPYFNNGRNYNPLFNEIVSHSHNGKEPLHSQKLYSLLYPDKKFSNQTLRNRLSELFKLGEEFSIIRRLDTNPVEKEKLLLQNYLDKKLFKLFESKYLKTKKIVDLMPDNDVKFKNISFLKTINLTLLDSKNTLDAKEKQHYERSMYSLCIFLIEIFEDSMEFILQEYESRKREYNIVEEIIRDLQIEKLIQSFEKSELIVHKSVCIHYYLYRAFSEFENEQYYYKAKNLFNAHSSLFSNDYKEKIYNTMINYCLIRQNSGIKKYQHELFKIYNEKLEQKLFEDLRSKAYPVNSFRDYVFVGIELKEYKWVKSFIEKYSSELPNDIRNDERNLSYAKLYFAERDFEKSLQHLNKVSVTNYLHYMDASVLKMCCYYEFDRIEDSYYEIDRLKHYMRNHREIPEIHRVPNRNFLKIYQKLISNKSNHGNRDLGFLDKEIRTMKFISKGQWLVEKIKGIN